MDRPILYSYFEKKADELLANFKLSSEQRASRNIGDNREIFINNFLQNSLPPKLSVRNGEIWDKDGWKTGQIDTLIIRDDAPSLDFGGKNVYLAEGIFAIIEVKSNLTIEKLKEAIKSLENVKQLSIPKPTVTIGGYNLGRPLRIVFAYSGATWETINKYLVENNKSELFDLICILDKGVLVRRGRLIFPYDKTTGEKFKKDIIVETKASSLGFLYYYYLIQYGSSFSAGNIDLQYYFQPLENWGK
jgi:hypothetical protein